MASMQALKRRIKTAQNVSKTTRAMQMIAASKLKKAQDATLSSRPYVQRLTILSQKLATHLETIDTTHPYLEQRTTSGKTLLVVIAPDKGLCGGLVTNLLRELSRSAKSESYRYIAIGKKAESYAAKLGDKLLASFRFGTSLPLFDQVYPIATLVEKEYLSETVDKVLVLSTHYNSAFSQRPTIKQLLPIQIDEQAEKTKEQPFELFEPKLSDMLPTIVKHYFEMTVYQTMLESFLSEQAARMIAMQNATDNAKEIISALTLEYNKARQARITSEILDISSAAVSSR
jgi:F-type H+-transporting ATPase subunit gamma